MCRYMCLLLAALLLIGCAKMPNQTEQNPVVELNQIKVATFNVSMEATNYSRLDNGALNANALVDELATGNNQQMKNIAEIIQITQPDIILLNEFDHVADTSKGIEAFQRNYLSVSQNGQSPIEFPYYYLAPVNTGVKVPEQNKTTRFTHFGFGRYPGQYGMVLLSKYPIQTENIRTFQHFLWQHMPNNLMPVDEDGKPWYSEFATKAMRLSSKSHWDIPVDVCGSVIHVLASHPTPPVFDGPEDRNGRRNFDEIRFWRDYIEADKASYHYDDEGGKGGIKPDVPFVILGDLNASSVEGDAYPGAMSRLLEHKKINNYQAPASEGGRENKPDSQYASTHTAGWGMRADYVLPSNDLKVAASGVFWPNQADVNYRLVKDRNASSDHRLVWATMNLTTQSCSAK